MMRIPFFAFISVLFFGPIQNVLAAADLVPHRALYNMSLIEASPRSGITGAQGAMMYRFDETCDAWTSETKVILKIVYSEGEEVETTWSYASWEAKDGLNYRFNVRHNRNGKLVEVLEGKANRDLPNGPGKAVFSIPKGTTIDLPEGTMFPTRHLISLIEAGQKRQLIVSEIVFDGASLENPYQINALITNPDKKNGKMKLRHHVRMAFFPVGGKSEEPEFELGVTYHSNGVAERIRQDFGTFSLDLTQRNIEVLSKPDC